MIKPVELYSALRRELDWSCLREKALVSPRSSSEARKIKRSSLTRAQGAGVKLDLVNPDSDYNRLSTFLDSHLNLQIFYTENVHSLPSSQVISLISTGRAFIPAASDHVLFG